MSACLTGIIGLAIGFTTFSSHAVQLDTVTVIGCNGTLITDGYGREMCVRDGGGGGGGGSGGVIRGDYGGGSGGRGGVGVTDTAIG